MDRGIIANILDCIYGISKRYFQLINIYIILLALIVLEKDSEGTLSSMYLQGLQVILNKLDVPDLKHLVVALWSALELLELVLCLRSFILEKKKSELINCCEITAAIIMVLFMLDTGTIHLSIDAIIATACYLFSVRIIFSWISKHMLLDTRYFRLCKIRKIEEE